jgi:hypothetical protein
MNVENMNVDWRKIRESKDAFRRRLACLPVAEKLRMLDVMQEQALAFRGAGRSQSQRQNQKPG